MKKLVSVLVAAALLCGALSFLALGALAEEPYTLITAGTSKESATEIDVNTLYALSLTGKDTLFLRFTTPAQGGFFDFYSLNISVPTHSWDGDSQVRFELIDPVDQVFAANKCTMDEAETENLRLLPASTYYVRIHNYWVEDESVSGYLKLKLTYTEDLVPDKMERAAQFYLGQEIVGTMDGKDDIDFFQFTTADMEKYEFSMKNVDVITHTWSSDFMFRVQIRNGINEIIENLQAYNGDGKSETVTLLPNTTYYIFVNNPWWEERTGTYTFCVKPIMG